MFTSHPARYRQAANIDYHQRHARPTTIGCLASLRSPYWSCSRVHAIPNTRDDTK